jgi:hypothetical protein
MRTITRATSRPGLCSALIVAAALASCGGSDEKPATTAATSVATTTKAPTPPAPNGRLSAAEYETTREVVVRVGKLERSTTKVSTRALQSACRAFASGPRTELMVVNRSGCVQLVRLLEAVRQFGTRKQECEQAAQAGDVSCYAQLYRALAGTARVLAVRGEQANAVVRTRRLAGACARVVGTSGQDLDGFRAIARHARGAALALEAKDEPRLRRAQAAIARDFQSRDDESTAQILRWLRTCRG